MKCYKIQDESLTDAGEQFQGSSVCVCTTDELDQTGLKFARQTIEECCRPGSAKLESYDGYDFILLNVVTNEKILSVYRIGLYITAQQILFVCNRPCKVVDHVLESFVGTKTANLNEGKLLYTFFNRLTSNDAQELQDFEEEISKVEESIIENKEGDYTREIVSMRKKLMFYKNYYEQLLDVAEGMEENTNGILPPNALRYFKMFTNRVDRLNRSVMNLRDYITQVREAYQSQVDIKLNEIMKLFTVVTAIFLPLTLLVGWYGMNFKYMPELNWPFGYFLAIFISVLFVVVSIIYFKKKKIL